MAGLFNYCRVRMRETAAVLKQIQSHVQSLRFRGKHLFRYIKPLTKVLLDFLRYILWNKSMKIIIANAILKYVRLQSNSLWQFLFMQFLKTKTLEKFSSNTGKTVLFPKWTRVIWNQRDLNSAAERGCYPLVIPQTRNTNGGDGRETYGHKRLP